MAAERADAVLGAVVLAAAVGFLVYLVQITGAAQMGRDGYEVTASFRSADGVRVGTDVRLAGVKIGSVTHMALNPETYRADLTLGLRDTTLVLPDDSLALIAAEGLLGGIYIDIVPGGSPYDIEPGAQIHNTQSAVSLPTLLMRFVTGGDDAADASVGAGAGAGGIEAQP